MDSVAALLFDGFELLDVFGPLEAFGHLAESGKCRLITVAERAGAIASRQGPRVGVGRPDGLLKADVARNLRLAVRGRIK